jgi:hypothetical protein
MTTRSARCRVGPCLIVHEGLAGVAILIEDVEPTLSIAKTRRLFEPTPVTAALENDQVAQQGNTPDQNCTRDHG